MCVNTWVVMVPHGDRTVLSLESAFFFLFFGHWMRNLCKFLGRTYPPNSITLKMEAACFSEVLVFSYSYMWCANPEQ